MILCEIRFSLARGSTARSPAQPLGQERVRDVESNETMVIQARLSAFLFIFLLPAFCLASNFQHGSQFYSDSQNTSGQSQSLQYLNDFYLVEDPTYQTTVTLQYQYDSWHGLPATGNTTQNAFSDLTTNAFNLNLSQGVFTDTSLLLNGGYSFGSGYQTFTYGVGINPRFFRNNTALLVGLNRITGNQPPQTFLGRDFSQITTSNTRNGTDYYAYVTQTVSKTTIGRIGWRYDQMTDLTDAQVLAVRIHQWLPTQSAIQLEYSYFLNVGNIPRTTPLGKLKAHTVEALFNQYLTRHTTAGLRYRYYKETEQVGPDFGNILGSDLFGLSLNQDLAPLLKKARILRIDSVDNANLAFNIDRYVNNQDRKGWIVSLATNITF